MVLFLRLPLYSCPNILSYSKLLLQTLSLCSLFSVALILQMFRLSLSVGSDGISFINLPALRLPRRKAMGRSVTKGLAIPRAVYCNLLCDVTISSWLE